MKRQSAGIWVVGAALTGFAGHARAGAVAARFRWEGAQARLAIEVTAPRPAPEAEQVLKLPLAVQAATTEDVLWRTQVEVPLTGEPPWRADIALAGGITNRAMRGRIMLQGRRAELGIDYHETLTVERADAALQTYGYRHNGVFPEHTVHLTCGIAGFRTDTQREVPVALRLSDAEGNLVLDTLVAVQPERTNTWHALDVTPRGPAQPVGPFRLETGIESDVHAIRFRTTYAFAWANAHVPVSAMEDGRPSVWFAAHGTPPTAPDGRGFYYSAHLANLEPADEPRIDYDSAVRHGGTRALRVAYRAGQPAFVWGRRSLPGKPTCLTVWVKGNTSGDRLLVTFEDNINYSLPGWGRRADFATETVCTLDFDGWRLFRVPVLGAGQPFDSFAGSSDNTDAPISITAFRIEPGVRRRAEAPEERRTLWIGALGVETQARPGERLALEVRTGDRAGRLRADDTLMVTVGNGWAEALSRGRLSLSARDGADASVYSAQHDLQVPAGEFACLSVPLAPLAALRPQGPVVLEVAFQDATMPGARVVSRLTLKAPLHAGVFLDFAEPTVYSGYIPGEVTAPTSCVVRLDDASGGGGLELGFAPDAAGSALLHPCLDGYVATVTVRVRARGAAAVLQPWFVDAGRTGVSNRPHNLFWADPITLEPGDGWQEVTVDAPPLPADYNDPRRTFLFEPAYPLNLALRATARDAGGTGTLQVARISLTTHLAEADALKAEVVQADDSGIYPPGSPLELALRNLAPTNRVGEVRYSLRNSHGRLVADRRLKLDVPPGARQRVRLLDALEVGIYRLEATVFERLTVSETLTVVDAQAVFGADPLAALRDPVGLRLRLGLGRQPVYLDWDNSEPAPNAFEFGWFDAQARQETDGYRLQAVPILGFSTDWAGPEQADAVAKGDYLRTIGNLYQTPLRAIDWDCFVREALREVGGRFPEIVFWENPDLDESPQHVPPERYAELLRPVARWARLYAPKARVVAGGFNYDKALAYLDRIPEVAALPFDRIAVQMNIGELSPEGADIEGYFDELDRLLNLHATGRDAQAMQCDWGIGPLLSPIEHAAYHARTLLILASRGAAQHDFGLANAGFTFDGYGLFYRQPYGNNEDLQHLKPFYLPKPAFFALRQAAEFVHTNVFVRSVELPDLCRDRSRVFLYRAPQGGVRAVLWRAQNDTRAYRLPERWAAAPLEDIFGFAVAHDATLDLTPLPYLLTLPPAESPDEVVHTLRHLPAVDGDYPVLLDLYTHEADSARRAQYAAEGPVTTAVVAGRLPGRPRRRQDTILQGLRSERFVFESATAGAALLTRSWRFTPGGQRLQVQLNDDPEQVWDLTSSRDDEPGPRESTFLLRRVTAGRNTVTIKHATPGNSAGYRVEPLPPGADSIDLSRWGMLHALQTRGDLQLHRNSVGTPLRIGAAAYATGIGAHAASLIELPLDGQFHAVSVTVGVDAHTEGRGTVRFRIFADDREVANSGVLSGLSEPVTLKVGDLSATRRLVLSVTDAEDGDANDLANWVEGRLELR